jgi:hypothetical protein
MKLHEGGNMFSDAEPFDHVQIPAIMKQINSVLTKVGARALPIGSGATPTPGKVSGDLDMIVDANVLADKFKSTDAKEVRKQLRNLFDQAGFQTAQSGVSVHVRTEVNGAAQQVDIMVVPEADTAQKFHTHTIPQGSKYKGVHKQIAMAALAKEQNLLWSAYEGLYTRGPDGKKNKLYSNDIDQIAKTLLGNTATGKDLGSFESILAALPPDRADALKAKLEQDPSWQKVTPQESVELNRIRELAGL